MLRGLTLKKKPQAPKAVEEPKLPQEGLVEDSPVPEQAQPETVADSVAVEERASSSQERQPKGSKPRLAVGKARAAAPPGNAAPAAGKARSWFKRRGENADAAVSAGKHVRPIRLLMGFLPEVTQKDAQEFALGLAYKYCDQIGMVWYGAYPMDGGFVYEIQEGGTHKAYAPAIIEHFASLPPDEPGNPTVVRLAAGQRIAQIERARTGLSFILLPEDTVLPVNEEILPTKRLIPAVPTRPQALVVGAILFIMGTSSFIVANVARIQPYEATPNREVRIVDFNKLPSSQLDKMETIAGSGTSYVGALKLEKGKWVIDEISIDDVFDTPAKSATSAIEGPAVFPGAQRK